MSGAPLLTEVTGSLPDDVGLHPSDVVLVEWDFRATPSGRAKAHNWTALRQLTTSERWHRVVHGTVLATADVPTAVRYRFFTVAPESALWVASIPVSVPIPATGMARVVVSSFVEVVVAPGDDTGTHCEMQVSLATFEEWCAVFRGADGVDVSARSKGGSARITLRCRERRLVGTLHVATAGQWYQAPTLKRDSAQEA